MNASVFLSRLQALRASKDDNLKKNLQDKPELPKKERLNNVFKAIFAAVTGVKGSLNKKNMYGTKLEVKH